MEEPLPDRDNNRPRPFLMIPLRRCGSHALRLRLNINPRFYAPYPLHLVDFMPTVDRYYRDLTDDAVYFQLIRDVLGLQDALMVRWENVAFDPTDIFEAIKDEPRSIHRIAWELLLQAGEQRKASIVLDKSLDNVQYADELFALFPNIGFLNVVRDPRAQVSSMNRSIIHEFDTYLNARQWVRAMELGRQVMEKYPNQTLTVRFEDFLTNQREVLQNICNFMGIEFMAEMLEISQSREALKMSGLSSLWESNSSPPILMNSEKYRKNLTMEEIEIIETLARDHMDFFGYQRMTEAKANITREMESAAMENDRKNRQDAWRELKLSKPRDYILRRYRIDTITMIEERLKSRPWRP